MKGKPDVKNEGSHILLHFLIIKQAARFTWLGGGDWLVQTGRGSDAAGTASEWSLRRLRSPKASFTSCAGGFPGCSGILGRCHNSFHTSPQLPPVYFLPL